jgi:hypothetical protein
VEVQAPAQELLVRFVPPLQHSRGDQLKKHLMKTFPNGCPSRTPT